MYRRKAAISFLGVLFVLVSCIDSRYDLVNKDISTDVKIEGNRIAVPIGSLKAITLDSIVDTDEIDILEKGSDGVYSISMDDSIEPIEIEIDPVRLSIDLERHTEEIDFATVDLDSVHVEATHIDPVRFTVPEISLAGLNKKLPRLQSSVVTPVSNEKVDAFFAALEKLPSFKETVAINGSFSTGVQEVSCDFEYSLPAEVETISDIRLGDNVSSHGTLVEIVITSTPLFERVSKSVDFTITFPAYFVLYTGNKDYTLSAARNEISVRGLELKGNRNVVSFYIQEVKDLDSKVKDGVLKVDDKITYSLEYVLEGDVELSSSVTREDMNFNVGLDAQLTFCDAKGRMKDVNVEFDPIVMDFKGHFNDLEYIDTIYYVDFDEEKSRLRFESSMETDWLSGFSLKEGYALKIDFPDDMTIDDSKSSYEGKGDKIVYSAEDHAFYIYDLRVLGSTHWNLALDSLILDVPVEGDECDIDVEAEVYFVNGDKQRVGEFAFGGIEIESMMSALARFAGTKEAEFSMASTDLVIKEASVHTEVVRSELDAFADFSIEEEIPEEIECIEGIDFLEDVLMSVEMSVAGLDRLDTEVHLDLNVTLPSFLKVAPSPRRANGAKVAVDGSVLHIEAAVNPNETSSLGFGLLCTGLDFRTGEFGLKGIMPKDSTDGKSYLVYDGDISISGDAYIDGVEFHSDVLEKLDDLVFDINVSVSDMEVKAFHGFYRGEIDDVEESFDLDLGDELSFLKEEGNSMTLAEPQIEIVLENTIGVPVDVDMQIFGRDSNGEIISASLIKEKVSIQPAAYDEKTGEITPVETRLFLTADSNRVSKAGYTNVEIKNLANLLKRIPETIDFKIKPVVTREQTHHVDISKPLMFSGSYAVNIPLKLDNFNFVYNDTITGLADSFGENLDMLSNIQLSAKMKVTNTIPLTLDMNAIPLDVDGKPVKGMEIAPVTIKAGSGGEISASAEEAQEIVLSIKSASGDFSMLDMLSLSIEAATDHTTGSAGLMGEQGIKIEDIVLEIVGDIETDLSE